MIDAAAGYLRMHPGAGEDEVIRHIPHEDTPENRMLVRSALPVKHASSRRKRARTSEARRWRQRYALRRTRPTTANQRNDSSLRGSP